MVALINVLTKMLTLIKFFSHVLKMVASHGILGHFKPLSKNKFVLYGPWPLPTDKISDLFKQWFSGSGILQILTEIISRVLEFLPLWMQPKQENLIYGLVRSDGWLFKAFL